MTQEVKFNIVYNVLKIPHSEGIDNIIKNDKYCGIRQLLMKINIYRSSIAGNEIFKGTSWENIITNQLSKENQECEYEESD